MSYYKISILLFFISSFSFSQNLLETKDFIEKGQISNQSFFNPKQTKIKSLSKKSNEEFVFCDDDSDGFISIDLGEIKNYILNEFSLDVGVSQGVYICTNNGKILLATDLNNNPQINYECTNTNGLSMLDIAINQNGECFVSANNTIKKINLNNCNIITNYSTSYGNINALSFDLNQNLYLGGFDSKVYRADSNNLGQSSPWHDFNQGYAAGDFVIRGGKMYIAWNISNDCRLYEVTINSNYDYVSHVDLGLIPSSTFGLASELGQLYGVTPTELYKINTTDMTFESILTNNVSGTFWYGASGKNEAMSFDVNVFETNNDALNGINPLPNNWINTVSGGQTVFISIVNTLKGDSTIIPVNIVDNTPPSFNNPIEVVHCNYGNSSYEFDLEEIKSIINNDSNVQISYYLTENDALNNSNSLPLNYVLNSSEETIYVKLNNQDNDCYSIFNFKLKVESVPICNAQDISICNVGLFNSSGNINLNDYTSAILGNQDSNLYSVSYYLSQNDAEFASNEVFELVLNGSQSDIEIFVRVEKNNSSCFAICNFLISIDDYNLADSVYYEIAINEGTVSQNSIVIELDNVSDYVFSLNGIDFQAQPYFTGVTPGDYSVHIMNSKTCQYSIESLYILNYPNYFTPNGDGYNDLWKITSSNLEPNMKIYIYDRFGKLLKELSPNSEGWDGTYIGNSVPSSDYWFKIVRENGKEISGHFSLKR